MCWLCCLKTNAFVSVNFTFMRSFSKQRKSLYLFFFLFLPYVYGSFICGNYMLLFIRCAADHIIFFVQQQQLHTSSLELDAVFLPGAFDFIPSRCFCGVRLLK